MDIPGRVRGNHKLHGIAVGIRITNPRAMLQLSELVTALRIGHADGYSQTNSNQITARDNVPGKE
jgi:hypothetical protein